MISGEQTVLRTSGERVTVSSLAEGKTFSEGDQAVLDEQYYGSGLDIIQCRLLNRKLHPSTVLLKTNFGYSLEASDDQELLTLPSSCSLSYAKISSLKVGDYVAISRRAQGDVFKFDKEVVFKILSLAPDFKDQAIRMLIKEGILRQLDLVEIQSVKLEKEPLSVVLAWAVKQSFQKKLLFVQIFTSIFGMFKQDSILFPVSELRAKLLQSILLDVGLISGLVGNTLQVVGYSFKVLFSVVKIQNPMLSHMFVEPDVAVPYIGRFFKNYLTGSVESLGTDDSLSYRQLNLLATAAIEKDVSDNIIAILQSFYFYDKIASISPVEGEKMLYSLVVPIENKYQVDGFILKSPEEI